MTFERWRAVADTWPDVTVSEEAFTAYVRDRRTPEQCAHDSDLYLACACAQGDAAALAVFERTFFGDVEAVAARFKRAALPAEELKQLLRDKLFAQPRPRILEYSGHGSLRAWFRITATRLALNVAAHAHRERPVDDETLAFLLGGSEDPEIGYLKRTYGDAFREAFREGFLGLESRERNLLRYAFGKSLTVDAIGAIYDVHRATAARWVRSAVDRLASRVKQALRGRLGLSERENEEILRLIQSNLQITLERYMESAEP
jgi:RNA polymerase sigma-70 factor (ECF subfamily)